MTTPKAAIAALDNAVRVAGETVKLRRTTGTQQIPLDVECRACVRNFAPTDFVGPIVPGDRFVILSPTEMKRAQWTWPPRANDKLFIGGRQYTVQAANPISIGGVLARIEMQVRG